VPALRALAVQLQLQVPLGERSPNPARERGLRRAGRYRAPCAPVSPTPMPAPVDALHMLALLTRVRQARIDAGEIKAPQGRPGQTSRLYDVRAYKCVVAELAYLRRLAAVGKTGGAVVTSMAQLVAGLARLHPAWKMDGDKFADRDRHHRAVRRRLRDLQDMGLLRWRAGVDEDGEEARTELELLVAPDASVDELADAAAQLKRWKTRYGRALNTGSSTGIRDAVRHARPLSASERQRRGIVHARARAQLRRDGSTTNSDPHFEASATPKNSHLPNHLTADNHACGSRTGARTSMVTRSHDPVATTSAPRISPAETASLTEPGPDLTLADFEATRAARFERSEAIRAARQPVFDVIAAQSDRRAREVASWALDRGWPMNRLREAFAVWRYGAMHVAEHSWDAAGPIAADDAERLRRAAARYERHGAARPGDYPAGALAALAEIAATAAERGARPCTLHYAIRALDQLSRHMRASATASDPQRLVRKAQRAHRRRAAQPDTLRLHFRIPRPAQNAWPAWVALDASGAPLLVDGELVIRDAFKSRPGSERQPWVAPPRSAAEYLDTLRDAHLLRGLWPPIETDGRSAMAYLDERYDDAHPGRRRALPGPYALPHGWRERPEPEDLELARLAPAMTLRRVQRLDVDMRDKLLGELRARARDDVAERADDARLARDEGEWGTRGQVCDDR
jgi:hypothetical protein